MRNLAVALTLIGALTLSSSLARAQAPAGNSGGTSGWVKPRCDIKPANFLVNGGQLHLKAAAETRFDDVREREMRDAEKVLTQAVTTGGQEKNPAAWYYLGRYYIARFNAVGADSAFRKAEELQPTCRDDILGWRREVLWRPLYNTGIEAIKANNVDSAISTFRRAATVYDGDPITFAQLGALFFNSGQADSAAKYFLAQAMHTKDPAQAADRKTALFNYASALELGKHYDSAGAAYRSYMKDAPNDPAATIGLARVFAAGGHEDSAFALYRSVISRADSMDANTLFLAGVALYNSAPDTPDTAALGGRCRTEKRAGRTTLTLVQRRAINAQCDSASVQALRANDATGHEQYLLAVHAFEMSVSKDSLNRNSLFNLSRAYMKVRDLDHMLSTARKVVNIDPLNQEALRTLAYAWQLKGVGDSSLHYVVLSDSLIPVDITVGNYTFEEQGANLSGVATNYHTTPSQPLKLVFEFLSIKGEVVASQTVDIPGLAGQANHAFQTQVTGAGIAGWRYKKG